MQLHHSADQQSSLQNMTLEAIQCDFGSLSFCDQFFLYFYIEHIWCFHIIPIFLRKWINHFPLGSLFAAFCKVLILADLCVAAQPKGNIQSYSTAK